MRANAQTEGIKMRAEYDFDYSTAVRGKRVATARAFLAVGISAE